ncbi:MAG: integrase [Proteobacteria bacterium]|nr:integrase [Pseudomonadota bacterium]
MDQACFIRSFSVSIMKAKKVAMAKYPDLDFQFTFHDLKAKGISDLKGTLNEKQEVSGNKNVSQTAKYNRKVSIVPVVRGQ